MTAHEDLAAALATTERLATRLRDALARMGPFLPFDAERVAAVDAADPLLTDAFLKRFENLANHLQDQLWRRVAVEEGFRDPTEMSRRDLANLMEKFGLLVSADRFADVVRTRNRLSHIYPNDPEKQAGRLNEAWDRSQVLLAAAESAAAWAARRFSPPAQP